MATQAQVTELEERLAKADAALHSFITDHARVSEENGALNRKLAAAGTDLTWFRNRLAATEALVHSAEGKYAGALAALRIISDGE